MEFLTTIMASDFTAYVALAFVLYAIREATKLSNRYVPLVGLALGLGYAILDAGSFDSAVLLAGIQNAAYGIATVAGVKYTQDKVAGGE